MQEELMKNILFVASECVPFIKTGGLADVVGTLPKMFDKNEYDCRVILPNYRCIPDKFRNNFKYVHHFIWIWVSAFPASMSVLWNMSTTA